MGDAKDYNADVCTGIQDETPLGATYDIETIHPTHVSLVPILRSGLGMIDGNTPFLCSIVNHLAGS